MKSLPRGADLRTPRSIVVPNKLRQSARRLTHEFVKCAILFFVAEVVDLEFQAAQTRALANLSAPIRMGALKGFEEQSLLRRRKMADLKNDLEMRRRNRRGVGGIAHVRNETTILPERSGEPLPRARGSFFHDIAQNGLVGRDIGCFDVATRRGAHP